MNRKIFLAIAMASFFGLTAKAEDYSVSQLIDLAVSKSEQINVAELEARSREKEASQAAVWENPTLDLGTENKNETGGSTRQWKVGASQTIGVPGKYSLRGDVADADFRIAKLERSNTELFLRHDIFVKIFSFLAAEERAKHAEERLSRFKEVQTYIRSRTFASPQKRAEATIVSGKLMVLEKELLKFKAETDVLWDDVNLFLGLVGRPKIRANWFLKGKSFSFENLRERLDSTNPELNRQKLVVEKSEKQLRLSRKDAWPTFTVSGSYADGNGFAPERIYGLGLSFPIPAFNSNSAGIQASQFRQQAEISKLSFERDRTLLRLKSALLRYETSRSAVQRLSVNRISEIEKGMTITDQGFRKGQVDLLTYIEADSQHSESLEAIYAAQTEYASYLSNLLTIVGEPTIPLETQP